MASAVAPAKLGAELTSILDLPARIAALDGDARVRAERLLDVRRVEAITDPPSTLEPWIARTFGSVEAVRHQAVIKVSNRVTGEATLFAPLRARRPMDGESESARADLQAEIESTEDDPFCDPESGTPAHPYGRVRGARMITGANAAAADAHHAVLVFDEHDPLAFDRDLVADLFATARSWAETAHAADPTAGNYLLIWNCLWRAGGSIVHGHAQALLGTGPHYAAVERFRRASGDYRAEHDAELAGDLAALHADLGLAHGSRVATLASLTPAKERELIVIGFPGMDEREPAFTDAVANGLLSYRDRIGVRSFNLALWRPPLVEAPGWAGIPPMVHLVDRGDPFQRPSDIGAMELFGTPVVGADPYDLIEALG